MAIKLCDEAAKNFERIYGAPPKVGALAPGRVEVLGNHTDYNGGYVMSAAIDRRTCIVAGPAAGSRVSMHVTDTGESASISAAKPAHDKDQAWPNYVAGVIEQILKLPDAPALGGMNIAIHGDVPLGGGLSSSASLEVATALAVKALNPFEMEPMELARLCQRAENEFVGVKSGLMDQFSSVFGQKGHFLFLDCLTLEHEALPLAGHAVSLVVCDCMVKHQLTGGEYNSRREECESAARKLGQKMLRDVTSEMLESCGKKLSDNEYKRARHVVDEDDRVLRARDAVRAGDVKELGRLMTALHESSRTCFENSTSELDELQQIALRLTGCLGARLTGGGFGGSVLALVKSDSAKDFSERIGERYGRRIGKTPSVFVCELGGGAETVNIG